MSNATPAVARKLILFNAMSLDACIADNDRQVAWLHSVPNPDKDDYGYMDFLQSVDTTIMGHTTYAHMRGFPGEYQHKDRRNIVLTRNAQQENDEYAEFISDDVISRVEALKKEEGKNIFLVGGRETNTFFLEAGLIDEVMFFIMPIILGAGMSVFSNYTAPYALKQIDSKVYSSGVVKLHYSI